MRRIVRQAATFVGLVILVGLLRLPFADYGSSVVEMLRDAARGAGIDLQVKRARTKFPLQVDMNEVAFAIPTRQEPVPVLLNAVHVSPRLLPLLLLRSDIDTRVELYSGTLDAEVSYRVWGESGTLQLSADGLHLEEHPQIAKLGVSGNASFELDTEFQQIDSSPELPLLFSNSVLQLTVQDGRYSGTHRLGGLLELPNIDGIALTLNAESIDGKQIEIRSCEVFSSMGTADGSGSLVLKTPEELAEINFEVKLELSAEGAKTFAPYLALAAGMPIDNPPRSWRISITQQLGQRVPKTIIKPL